MTEPRVAYDRSRGRHIEVDRAFYKRLADRAERRKLIDRFVVPIRSGRAWLIPARHLCRIIAIEGPQVGDFNAWNLQNPRERFWGGRTKQLYSAHLTTYDRLWSCPPFFRPLLTITNDTVQYGIDEDGGGCHDLLGTRCDPYVHKLMSGEDYDFSCHSNLIRAVAPYRLGEDDIHDAFHIFMVAGLTKDHRFFVKPSPARKGDFIELFAEIDVLCAVSTCPLGDQASAGWGGGSAVCHPLGVEVYEPDVKLLEGWAAPRPVEYKGLHGFQVPGPASL